MGNTFDRIPIKEQARGIVSAQRSTCALACLVIALLALLLGGATAGVLAALLSGLLQVAQSGFFLRMWRGESVGVADMLASMADDGFLRKVGGMLWVQLQVFLYSLLLIVPGLMRAYSLALTPLYPGRLSQCIRHPGQRPVRPHDVRPPDGAVYSAAQLFRLAAAFRPDRRHPVCAARGPLYGIDLCRHL